MKEIEFKYEYVQGKGQEMFTGKEILFREWFLIVLRY